MPENLNQKFEQSAVQEKIAELAKQIKELEEQKKEAVESVAIEPMKKEKKVKKQAMAKIDLPNEVELRQLRFSKEDNGHFKLFFSTPDGAEVEVSESDLLSDMQWDNFYDLNHEIKSQAHRSRYNTFRKKYLAAAYEAKIEKLKNELMVIKRLEIDQVGMQNYIIGEIYKEQLAKIRQKKERSPNAGFILEKMITGILTKLSYDLGEKYVIEVQHASVYDDVELKIDLIIKVADKNRAIHVEENDKVKGIQLTLVLLNSEKFKEKQRQVDKAKAEIKELKEAKVKTRIDDLVLIQVNVENKEISDAFKEWQRQGEIPGGPERFLSANVIVEKLLTGIFQETELDFNQNKQFKNQLWQYFEGKR